MVVLIVAVVILTMMEIVVVYDGDSGGDIRW